MSILDGLNKAQKEAVTHIDGALLVLAGAGTGKTKTITTRLAYLIKEVGIDPLDTLTLTFTNKAASQMRQRALNLIGYGANSKPLLCTFHKFGLIFLKKYIDRAGRGVNFNIIDSDDRKRIIKSIIKELKVDISPTLVLYEISKYKNLLLSPEDVKKRAKGEYVDVAKIYRIYESELINGNLVDFDDLIALPYKILESDFELRYQISQKYKYIMVDEYQDTNSLQYRLLKVLTSTHNNICVVGDDDQSIYGWRGANIKNIVEFDKQFKDAKVIKLEINYRSTQNILDSANSLIEYNRYRIGKKLISSKDKGESVEVIHSLDETFEARRVVKDIKRLISSGVNPDEIVVLYRINALSRSLEEAFNKEGIPFKLIGGLRFYERAEIKDIISYLRIISNPKDDFSLKRVINKPRRGVGVTTLNRVLELANRKSISLFDALKDSELETLITKRAYSEIQKFVKTIEKLQKYRDDLDTMVDIFNREIDIKKYYSGTNGGLERELNIDEFFGFFKENIDKGVTLEQFLNDISLKSDQDDFEDKAVNIMSIHASKGLEFENVYVIGVEEEFFPLLGDGCDIEEERRLAYVAITRAKSKLTLSYVDSRFYKGQRQNVKMSRFISEAGLIKDVKVKLSRRKGFQRGDLVKHRLFGIGRVEQVSRSGREYKLKINFGGERKDILSSFIELING